MPPTWWQVRQSQKENHLWVKTNHRLQSHKARLLSTHNCRELSSPCSGQQEGSTQVWLVYTGKGLHRQPSPLVLFWIWGKLPFTQKDLPHMYCVWCLEFLHVRQNLFAKFSFKMNDAWGGGGTGYVLTRLATSFCRWSFNGWFSSQTSKKDRCYLVGKQWVLGWDRDADKMEGSQKTSLTYCIHTHAHTHLHTHTHSHTIHTAT